MRQSENFTNGVENQISRERKSFDADLELIRRVGLNLPGAMEELIELHGGHLQKLIGSLTDWSSANDDLVQETLLKAWGASKSYRGDAPLQHWLTQIAVRVCRNHQRSYRRWIAHLKAHWEQRVEQDRTSNNELSHNDEMQAAIAKLAYADRELLVLYYFEKYSMSDIAAQLGVKESTLHVRLHRSRERLKTLLKNPEVLS